MASVCQDTSPTMWVKNTHRCMTAVRTARGRAEQGPPRSRGVIEGHVCRVVDDHPPGRRDGLGSGLLVVSGHLRSAKMN